MKPKYCLVMKPQASLPIRHGKLGARRSSPPPPGPPKRPVLARSNSIKSFSRAAAPGRPIEPKAVPVYPMARSRVDSPALTVCYRSCFYTFQPRPTEFFGIVESLRTVAVFTGEPVMTYKDAWGKLRYVADYHEMTRAYRDHPTQLTVDLRFD